MKIAWVGKQVTVCSNLSRFWAFHCFSTPLFVVLGASSKFRCLGKLSQPSSPSRQAKTVIFISKIPRFWMFFANSGCFCGWEATLWSGNQLLMPTSLTYDHFMKIKQLVANVTSISAVRAENGSFWVILDICWPILAIIVVGESLCDLVITSWVLTTWLRIF